MKKLISVLCAAMALLWTGGVMAGCGIFGGENPAEEKDYVVATYYFPNWGSQNKDKPFVPATDSEWGQIMNAKPKFAGHEQPKVPVWGYQDACDPAVMGQKITAAAENGIDVFIFDWYWYREQRTLYGKENGTYLEQELERGFLNAENRSDLDFALMWCNHDVGIDLKGDITPAEFEIMTDYIVDNYFGQDNVFKVDGKIYFSIYQIADFVDMYRHPEYGFVDIRLAKAALDAFRQKVRDKGLGELHINTMVWNSNNIDAYAAWPGGIPPANFNSLAYLGIDSTTSYVWIHDTGLGNQAQRDYTSYSERALETTETLMTAYTEYGIEYHPNLTMGWDSSPRCDQTVEWRHDIGYPYTPVLMDNTPARFRAAAEGIKDIMDKSDMKNKILTINSWNEWGEGSYLEPDDVNGYGYLWAIRDVFGVRGGK